MNLKKIGKVFTSKFVGTGPSSYKKRIYRAAVSQRLRNTVLKDHILLTKCKIIKIISVYRYMASVNDSTSINIPSLFTTNIYSHCNM